MLKKIRRLFTAAAVTLFVAMAVFLGAGYFAGPLAKPLFPVFGQNTPGVVSPGAILKEENCYLCGDVELIYQAPAPADILGRDLKSLRAKYPEKDGWSVEMNSDRLVVLRKNIDGFCGQHSLYRHLGIHRERLAVYQGPLGFNQRLLRVEEKKKVEDLPRSLREKLLKAREFDRLSAEERSVLRSDLEFAEETALNSAMENLDEVPEKAPSVPGQQ